jgi:hypothetical protein
VKKVAILGSAPSSLLLAPFDDPSWEIWGCSPGLYPHAKRVNAWFEIHRWEPGKPWFSPEYISWMGKLQAPVHMIQPVPEIPNSIAYPVDHILTAPYGHMVNRKGEWREKRFDRSNFSSSIAWMMALAMLAEVDVIGLWGVDMSAQEEWFFQRSGCQNMIDAAKSIGIQIVCPPESDLLRPPPLYGFCEIDPAHIKVLARKQELTARVNDAVNRGMNAQREADHLRGALDDIEYQHKTWVGNPFHLSQDIHSVVDPSTVVFDRGEGGNSEGGQASSEGAPQPPVHQSEGAPPSLGEGSPDQDNWRALEDKLAVEAREGSLDKLVNELSTAIGLSPHSAVNPLPSNTFEMGQQ